jgi:hypothetical protein
MGKVIWTKAHKKKTQRYAQNWSHSLNVLYDLEYSIHLEYI